MSRLPKGVFLFHGEYYQARVRDGQIETRAITSDDWYRIPFDREAIWLFADLLDGANRREDADDFGVQTTPTLRIA